MKTKSLAIILVLAVLMLAAGAAYSAKGPKGGTFGPPMKGHPWEGAKNNAFSGGSANLPSYDHKIITIPIFSDFFIWIYSKDVPKEDEKPKESDNTGKKSYQIIFSR